MSTLSAVALRGLKTVSLHYRNCLKNIKEIQTADFGHRSRRVQRCWEKALPLRNSLEAWGRRRSLHSSDWPPEQLAASRSPSAPESVPEEKEAWCGNGYTQAGGSCWKIRLGLFIQQPLKHKPSWWSLFTVRCNHDRNVLTALTWKKGLAAVSQLTRHTYFITPDPLFNATPTLQHHTPEETMHVSQTNCCKFLNVTLTRGLTRLT